MSFFYQVRNEISEGWMGLNLVFAVALISRYLHGLTAQSFFAKTFSEILVAVLLGLYVGNAFSLNKNIRAGARFALQRLLRIGIILLGLRLSLQDVAATGVKALLLVVICISLALALAYLAGRLFRIPPRLAALIGVGTAICGNTAIVATAPVIEANEEEMGFAVATITLFGLLAVLIYPLIGHAIGLGEQQFGLWAGTAVNDTSQVVAVAAIYSDLSLSVATIVKLTRNTLIAPLIILIGLVYTRAMKLKGQVQNNRSNRLEWGNIVPGFIIGFLIMAMVRSIGIALGVFPQSVSQPGDLRTAAAILKGIDGLSKFLILMALAGVGMNTNLSSLRRIGFKPLLVGTCVAFLLAAVSLSLILFTPLGG